MFVPAHNNKLLQSSLKRDADILLLDVEDSVPMCDKQKARDNVISFVKENKNKAIIFPRINDRESGELLKDAFQLTIDGVKGFVYPKATKGEDLYFFGKLLETIEYEKKIPIGTFKIIPLIETAGAVVNINEICSACPNRTVAVAFGCEDFVTDLHGQHDDEGKSIFTPRAMIAMAARANHIQPIDTVHIKVHDLEDLEKNLILSKKLGFEGMLVLSPKELPLVHKYYSPSIEDVEWANDILKLNEKAKSEGNGVVVKNNKFIGPPIVKQAETIIKKNNLINKLR